MTINQVRTGLEIWARLGYGEREVLTTNDTIIAGPSSRCVPMVASAALMAAGWTLGESGWEIRCD